ncbi:MAG: hypothetical protein L0Y71_24740 [Gemmataceae bacterium]|nr:hypothetical protein [Gemmataceae bacterium]
MKPISLLPSTIPGTIVAILLASAAAGAQEPKQTNKSLLGKTQTVEGLTLTAVELPAKDVVPALRWADAEGTACLVLDHNGLLRRISVPKFIETHQLDIGRKCEWLSISSQGLVVSVSGSQEVWLVDAASLRVKKKLAAPTVKQAVSGSKLSVAYVTNGKQLATLGLVTGKMSGAVKGEFESLAVTPDSNYLLTGSDRITRSKILKSGTLKVEEVGPVIASGRRGSGLMVSPDSKWVCLPTGGGNITGLPFHPAAKNYPTFVYPIKNLKKPDFALELGGYPEVVGFDPAAKLVLAQSADFPLIVCGTTGIMQQGHRLKDVRDVRQYLAHPAGRKLLLLAASRLTWVELGKE